MGRAEIRAQARHDRKDVFAGLPAKERVFAQKLVDGKLTLAEYRKALDVEFKRGFNIGTRNATSMIYAAILMAAKELYADDNDKAIDFLVAVDKKLVNEIDDMDMVQKLFMETGIELDVDDPFSTVKTTTKVVLD